MPNKDQVMHPCTLALLPGRKECKLIPMRQPEDEEIEMMASQFVGAHLDSDPRMTLIQAWSKLKSTTALYQSEYSRITRDQETEFKICKFCIIVEEIFQVPLKSKIKSWEDHLELILMGVAAKGGHPDVVEGLRMCIAIE